MKLKIVLIVVFFVALIQVINYGLMVDETSQVFNLENRSLAVKISSLESQSAALEKDAARLETKLAQIPQDFWGAFPDPEAGYMEFLNYLGAPLLRENEVSINMQQSPAFSPTPVPHHESRFSFTFSFVTTDTAERVLNFMLHQQRFPVKLSSLTLRGTGTGEVTADLAVSLHIPARDSLMFLTAHRETL
jgi:hypothetical protein